MEYDSVATPAEAMKEYAAAIGGEYPDQEWILTSWDTWEKNPHYQGAPGPHPEEDWNE